MYCSLVFQTAQRFEPAPVAARLTVVGARDPQLLPTVQNLATFGLLMYGCRLEPGMVDRHNVSITVTYPGPVVANGYFFELNSGPPSADPVQWVLETSTTGQSGDWELKGASGWRSDGGDFYFYPHLSFTLPEVRNASIAVDMTPSWNWALVWIVDNCVSAHGWLAFALTGATGWHKVGLFFSP